MGAVHVRAPCKDALLHTASLPTKDIHGWMIVQQTGLPDEIAQCSHLESAVIETDYTKLRERYDRTMQLWDQEVVKDPDAKWTRWRPQLVACVLRDVEVVDNHASRITSDSTGH